MIKNYISIARLDHWFKNIFVLPGILSGIILSSSYEFKLFYLIYYLFPVFCICIIMSANYTINEFLDANFDKMHPTKKYRPAALGLLNNNLVILQYIVLGFLGLLLSFYINFSFSFWSLILLIMGLLYNVKPFRTKDLPIIDILSESLNNPIRFILGWTIIIPNQLPPISFLLFYWMAGSFLMAIKRLAEYRTIDNKALLSTYRNSFKFYNDENLLLLSFFYAMLSIFSLTVIFLKYKIEFIICLPLFIILFVWYLKIGLSKNSLAQTPEKLYKLKKFVLFAIFTVLFTIILFFVEISLLDKLLFKITF